MRRREFITLLGGAAATWPLAARAQQADRVQRIGVLMNLAANDPESSKRMAAFLGGLQERGWTLGGNLQIEYRWVAGDRNLYRKYAPELVALVPDVMLAAGGTAVDALQQVTRTVPIVFAPVSANSTKLSARHVETANHETSAPSFDFMTVTPFERRSHHEHRLLHHNSVKLFFGQP